MNTDKIRERVIELCKTHGINYFKDESSLLGLCIIYVAGQQDQIREDAKEEQDRLSSIIKKEN